MSTPFQNRLVGTIIVAAVAIIVLPDLLDGNKKTFQDEFEQIPPPPKVKFVKEKISFPQDVIVNESPESLSDSLASDVVLVNEQQKQSLAKEKKEKRVNNTKANREKEKKPVTQFPDTIMPEKSVLKQEWVIQLGSFRYEKNVAQLLLKLKDNGYIAFTKPIKTKNGTLIKVFIGPELTQNSLNKKIPALKKLTGVQGKIARFYPTK
ncbi:MAG: SPOR domain-containing protein [Alteromonadaceae bacterium]